MVHLVGHSDELARWPGKETRAPSNGVCLTGHTGLQWWSAPAWGGGRRGPSCGDGVGGVSQLWAHQPVSTRHTHPASIYHARIAHVHVSLCVLVHLFSMCPRMPLDILFSHMRMLHAGDDIRKDEDDPGAAIREKRRRSRSREPKEFRFCARKETRLRVLARGPGF